MNSAKHLSYFGRQFDIVFQQLQVKFVLHGSVLIFIFLVFLLIMVLLLMMLQRCRFPDGVVVMCVTMEVDVTLFIYEQTIQSPSLYLYPWSYHYCCCWIRQETIIIIKSMTTTSTLINTVSDRPQ